MSFRRSVSQSIISDGTVTIRRRRASSSHVARGNQLSFSQWMVRYGTVCTLYRITLLKLMRRAMQRNLVSSATRGSLIGYNKRLKELEECRSMQYHRLP